MYGIKALLMSDADFHCYVMDIADNVYKIFKENNYKPTLEEFAKLLKIMIEKDFVHMVVYTPPYGEGGMIYLFSPKEFIELVERKWGIKNLYKEFFGANDCN